MLAATIPIATTVLAHHSHTRFDLERVIAFEGAVVRYEWTNPHVYLTVGAQREVGSDGNGKPEEKEDPLPTTLAGLCNGKSGERRRQNARS